MLERAVAADPARGAQWHRALEGASYNVELIEARARFAVANGWRRRVLRQATKRDVEDAPMPKACWAK